jgi:hypothetical protein
MVFSSQIQRITEPGQWYPLLCVSLLSTRRANLRGIPSRANSLKTSLLSGDLVLERSSWRSSLLTPGLALATDLVTPADKDGVS